MKTSILKAFVWAQIWRDENGQDLIEYGLVVALIALGATAGLKNFAEQISTAMSTIGSRVAASAAG